MVKVIHGILHLQPWQTATPPPHVKALVQQTASHRGRGLHQTHLEIGASKATSTGLAVLPQAGSRQGWWAVGHARGVAFAADESHPQNPRPGILAKEPPSRVIFEPIGAKSEPPVEHVVLVARPVM